MRIKKRNEHEVKVFKSGKLSRVFYLKTLEGKKKKRNKLK
jgi:hypothetical protein